MAADIATTKEVEKASVPGFFPVGLTRADNNKESSLYTLSYGTKKQNTC